MTRTEEAFARNGVSLEQFTSMRVVPHEYTDRPIMEVKSTGLKKLPTWAMVYETEDLELAEGLMRYTLYMYDPGSPMMKLFPDVAKRRNVAFDLADLASKAHRQEISAGRSNVAIMMAYEYLRMMNNITWNLIVTNENLFYETMKNMMDTATSDKDKDQMMTMKYKQDIAVAMDATATRIEKYLNRFYAGDKAMIVKHDVISSRMSSESIANKMSGK